MFCLGVKGLKFASVLSNGARVALNTENAVKNIATAIGISNEINRFNILYNKKHNNTNTNSNNGNNRHNGCNNSNNGNINGNNGSTNTNYRNGTTGYKTGNLWESLTPVNKKGSKIAEKMGKINKQALGGGEVRTDGEYIYCFDRSYQSAKIHLEMYKRVGSNKLRPYAECDPNTGKILRYLERADITW